MKKIKVLFLALHRPDRSPSQRFRFEQYINYLNNNGFECSFSWIISPEDDKIFYSPGNYWGKMKILWNAIWKRWSESGNVNADIVFVQRECFMLGWTIFERRFAKNAKMIFDFDDSIWLQNVSEANKMLAFLKDAAKTEKLIAMSDMIFAGNPYLAEYAQKFNSHVKIIPTTIDTEEYTPLVKDKSDKICIGWSGSVTTIQHFEFAIPALKKIKEKYGDKVCFKVVGDGKYTVPELGIQGLPWTKKDELKELCSMDIGLMPLPNDEWTNGKCGLKGLQYMALEIPTIMSAVGVNTEIIQDGKNGFLANTIEEWVKKIEILIDNEELRLKIAKAGRQTVIDHYSVLSQQDLYVKYFHEVLQTPKKA